MIRLILKILYIDLINYILNDTGYLSKFEQILVFPLEYTIRRLIHEHLHRFDVQDILRNVWSKDQKLNGH
jgi:hypothetical protein